MNMMDDALYELDVMNPGTGRRPHLTRGLTTLFYPVIANAGFVSAQQGRCYNSQLPDRGAISRCLHIGSLRNQLRLAMICSLCVGSAL